MINIKRTLIGTALALPLALGTTPAFADQSPTDGSTDGFRVETDVDSSDDLLEDAVIDLRVVSTDDEERSGVRSRTNTGELDDLSTDTRAVSQDDEADAFSGRAIIGLNELDDLDTDLDFVIIDDNDSEVDDVAGAESGDDAETQGDRESFNEDAAYVFGS